MRSLVEPGSQAEQIGRLFLAGVLVTFLPALPLGNYLIYPFTILTTWFHEMGHGLTALVLGHDFLQLAIFADGSGVALTQSSDGDMSRLSAALIAAGGPVAPTLAGAALIMASSRARWWRGALYALAAVILLSCAIWVRSLVGLTVLPLVALGIGAIAHRAQPAVQRFALQFLGVLAALSMFSDWGYLFTESAIVGGQVMLSDTGAIEANLFLPHWVWASLLIVFAAITIGFSLKYALAAGERRPGSRRIGSWR